MLGRMEFTFKVHLGKHVANMLINYLLFCYDQIIVYHMIFYFN